MDGWCVWDVSLEICLAGFPENCDEENKRQNKVRDSIVSPHRE